MINQASGQDRDALLLRQTIYPKKSKADFFHTPVKKGGEAQSDLIEENIVNDKSENEISELLDDLKRLRDELNLKAHLGKAEAVDLWNETEEKWRHLRSLLDNMKENEASNLSKDIGATTMLLTEEIKQAYEKLRKLL